ncbi:MAG: DUF6314 family protein [Bacteroidota bacterium]|nr:DUF6314 family protein [Bacteroidota bacterium]MEC8723399.1 DUF6314 family protein [Bacteroidota bacterium]
MNSKHSILKELIGSWSYEREFDNGSSGSGFACFERTNSNKLEYSETGTLNLTTATVLKSKRKYYFIANKNKLEIYFFENPKTLFQSFELKSKGNTLIGKANHQCGSDHYASEYIFKSDGRFKITHEVRGPKKKYSSKTIYSKINN